MRCEQHYIVAVCMSSQCDPSAGPAGKDVGDAAHSIDLYLRITGGNKNAHHQLSSGFPEASYSISGDRSAASLLNGSIQLFDVRRHGLTEMRLDCHQPRA